MYCVLYVFLFIFYNTVFFIMEPCEQHEQIVDGVEGTPDGTAQQHGGSSSDHGGQQVGDGAAGLYAPSP